MKSTIRVVLMTFAVFAFSDCYAQEYFYDLVDKCITAKNMGSCQLLSVEAGERCKANERLGCAALGVLYEHGWGIERSTFKAKECYEKACSLNYGFGCRRLGDFYREGTAIRQSYPNASECYEKACNLGDATGCYELGKLYDTGHAGFWNPPWKAKEYFGKACDLGYQSGCNEYAKRNK